MEKIAGNMAKKQQKIGVDSGREQLKDNKAKN